MYSSFACVRVRACICVRLVRVRACVCVNVCLCVFLSVIFAVLSFLLIQPCAVFFGRHYFWDLQTGMRCYILRCMMKTSVSDRFDLLHCHLAAIAEGDQMLYLEVYDEDTISGKVISSNSFFF